MMKQVTTTTTILASMIIILLIHVLVLGTTIGVVVNAQSSTFLGMKSSETRLVKPSCPLGVIGECVPWSTWYNSSVPAEEDEEIVIPCHTCVTMDITDGSSLQLTKGINVIGQLKFPSTTNTTIELPYIIVQGGLLEIQPPSDATSISPTNQYLKIIFTGPSKADEYYFEPFGVENLAKCVGGNASNKCNIGKKGITVTSGGTISIDSGISSETTKNCPTWTHVYDYGSDDENNTTASNITNTGLVLLPSDDKYFLPRPFAVKEECTDPVFDYKENFDNIFGSPGVTIITTNEQNPIDGQYLYVTNRIKSFQGVMMDLNTNCLEPNIPYLFSLKARLTSTTANTPSLCSQGLYGVNERNHCLRLMLTKQTSNLSYPTFKTLLLHSVLGAASVPDGQWFTFQGTIMFDPKDLLDENIVYSSLYLMGPEGGIDISLDDIKFTLPSTLSFPLTKQDVCKDLITNGHFSNEGLNTYPFYTSQNYGTHMSIEYSYGIDRTDTPVSEEDTINPYLSIKGRNQSYSSPMIQLNIGCIQHSTSYKIKNDIRVHSLDKPVTASMVLKKTLPLLDGQTIKDHHVEILGECQQSQNNWTTCETIFTVDNNHLIYEKIELFWDTNEGDDSNSILDIDTVSMKYIGGGSTSSIIVDSSDIAKCWGVNSEVLLTSHTLDYDDVTVTKIASTEFMGGGKSKLTFTTPVPKVTTQLMSKSYATEIALLTRNIVMEAPVEPTLEDIPVLDRGGHISIIHSDESFINIQGVELKGFGQTSKRGKYPIGIYNSKLTSNSNISHNSIHGSYQRCIVLDGTTTTTRNGGVITVSDNVSYDTQGHCYMITNDSKNIHMKHNLGSVTKNTPSTKLIRINTIPETDGTAATFYTTSALNNNRWLNNVASGSQSDGFFLSNSLSNDDENTNVIAFTNNTMHSNDRHGMVTYGWYSSKEVDLSGIKSYRNVEDGILLQNVGNKTITNSIISDNRIGIEIEKGCEHIQVSNTQIVGLSEVYQNQIEETSATTRSHCPAARPLVGIQFHSSSRYLDSSYGFALDTIDFNNFNSISTGCLGSTVIDMDIENYYSNTYVNALSTFKSITYDADATEDTKLNICDAVEDVGIKNVILKDIDDGLDGTGSGYIVSQDVAATFPNTITCTNVSEGCYSYCTTLECLHILLIAFSPDVSYETLELHIMNNDETTSTTNVYKSFILNETHPLLNANTKHYHQRRFVKAVLPGGSGNYTLEFKTPDGSEIVWPQYVETTWLSDNDVSCTTTDKPTINIMKPIVTSMETCNELSINGNVENGNSMSGWYYTGSAFINQEQSETAFEIISPGLGQTGSNAILLKNRQSIMDGIGQYLDSRCFVLGETYKVEAIFGLQQKSTDNYVSCDSSLSSKDLNNTQSGISSNICPRVTLQIKTSKGTSYAYPVATAVGAQGSTKNYLYGGFNIDETMVNAESIFLVIERVHVNRHLVVDDLTIVKHEDTCTSPILNGNFDTFGDSRGWFSFGNGIGFEITSPGSSGSDQDYALHTTKRDASIASPAQDINQNCIVDGDSFTVSASIKLMSSDGITPYVCNPSYTWGPQHQTQVCPNLIMVTQNDDGTTTSEVTASLSGTFTSGAWNQYYGNGRWKASHVNADRLFIMFSSFEPGVELYVDDIKFASKDNWNCTEAASTTGLVRNHNLQTGDARYWTGYGGALIKAEITDASTNNTSIRSYNRLDSKSGVGQMLDDGCLSTQDLYMVTANVKLYINTTQSIGCNPLSTSNIDRCPYIAIASQTYGSPIFIKPIATLWSGYGDSEDITSTSWIIEGEWNVLKGYFQLMQSELNANLKMIIVAGAPAGYDIIVDDVSFIKVSLNELGVPLVNSTTPE